MGNPLMDALDYVGGSLDKPGRAVRGLLGGRPQEALAAIPFSDAMGLTDPSNRVSGRDLLQQLGLLDAKSEGDGFGMGDLAGMGVEMATDPLNLLGGTMLERGLMGRHAAKANNAKRAAVLEAGGMPEEIAQLTKAIDPVTGKPLRVYHGTPHAFENYDLSKAQQSLYGPGVYTTDNPAVASTYSSKGAPRPTFVQTGSDQEVIDAMRAHLNKDWRGSEGFSDKRLLDFAKSQMNDLGGESSGAVSIKHLFEKKPGGSQNVRSHFIDTRKPFNVDAPVQPENFDLLQTAVESMGNESGSVRPDFFPEGFNRLLDMSNQGKVTGKDIFTTTLENNDQVPELLKHFGHDALTHRGHYGNQGQQLRHNVTIAFHPDQVYSPFVAPRLQSVPNVGPLLAALGGQNILAHGRGMD